MKKTILVVAMITVLLEGVGFHCNILYAASEESKSIGTETGEAARDMKTQFEEVSAKLRESAQALAQRLEEEWLKFNEAFNRPAKPTGSTRPKQ